MRKAIDTYVTRESGAKVVIQVNGKSLDRERKS